MNWRGVWLLLGVLLLALSSGLAWFAESDGWEALAWGLLCLRSLADALQEAEE